MVTISHAVQGQQFANQFAEAPLHAVADHGIADPLGNSDAKALAMPNTVRTGIGPDKQNQAGAGDADAAIGGQKISAAG